MSVQGLPEELGSQTFTFRIFVEVGRARLLFNVGGINQLSTAYQNDFFKVEIRSDWV